MKSWKQKLLLLPLLTFVLLAAIHINTKAETLLSGDCSGRDSNVKYSLSDTGVLTISGYGRMANYSAPNKMAPWYSYRSQIKSIVVEEGITYIGETALVDTAATSISIPSTVYSIGSNGIANNALLKTLKLPAGLQYLGTNSLAANYSLQSISIPSSNSYFTTVDGALYNKAMNRLIVYPSSKTGSSFTIPSSVTTLDKYAFFDADLILNLTIPASVVTIGDSCFSGMSSLQTVRFDSGSRVKELPYSCFASDLRLKSVTLAEGLEIIGNHAFMECASLETIAFPTTVRTIEYNSFKLSGLTTLTIPKTVAFIGQEAFYRCERLKTVRISDTTSLTIDSYAFSGCNNIEKFYLGKGDIQFKYDVFTGSFFYDSTRKRTQIQNLYVNDIVAFCAMNFANDSANPLIYSNNLYVNGSLTRIPQIPASVKTMGSYIFDRGYWSDAIDGVRFLGDAPEMNVYSIASSAFPSYYPADNATWTDEVRAKVKFAKWVGDCALTGKHSAGVTKVTEPTCYEDGKSDKLCPKCEYVLSSTVIKSPGHKYNLEHKYEPTCTSSGYSVGTCKVCGKREDYDYVDPLGHNMGAAVVREEATCTREGRKSYSCTRCDKLMLSEAIPALGHKNVSGECSRCGNITFLPCPEDFKVSMNLDGSLKCTWTAVKGAKNYLVYYLDNGYPKWIGTSTTTSFTVKDPVEGSHFFSVLCANTAGTKETSSRYDSKGEVIAVAPKPVIDKASNLASGIKLTWKYNWNAYKYAIYRKEAGGSFSRVGIKSGFYDSYGICKVYDGSEVTWTDKTAVNGHTYYYRICVWDANSKRISGYSSTSGKEIIRLAQPTDVKISATATGNKLEFSAPASSTISYQIYRKIGSSGTYKLLKTLAPGTRAYTHTGLKSGNVYYYKIRAKATSAAGTNYYGSYSTEKSRRFMGRPEISSLTSPDKSKISLKWTPVTKASGYQVMYAKKSDWSDSKTKSFSGQATASGSVSALTSGSKYYVRMRSYYTTSSGSRVYSAWTASKTVTVK